MLIHIFDRYKFIVFSDAQNHYQFSQGKKIADGVLLSSIFTSKSVANVPCSAGMVI